ncbi:sigma factor [Caloramator sp. mosi_1]|uniref:sigma factor n=1 Tax=Caloramator sp. mosi_1 TaxID=3023090 RepID=UPI003FCCDC58
MKKFGPIGKDSDDLISIGTVGLIKAIESFDYDKGNRLATYAARCIENEILMYMRSVKRLKLKSIYRIQLVLIKKEMKFV